MKKYKVISRKAVQVKVGTQESSELETLSYGAEFETAAAFASDLVANKWVVEVSAGGKPTDTPKAKTSEARK